MILKASERSGGANLAAHLMNERDNDHISVHELRGFAGDDMRSAFREAEAISLGTKCKNYLFSLSLSPPQTERVPVSVFENAIDRIEEKLGLEGQPRAIVFHEKEGRRHAHCVWSRIDASTMTARQISHFKMKLRDLSRELYLEQGWQLPRGLENAGERNPTNFTLGEWQQAKRQGMDPRWLKATLQACWTKSDNTKAFARALEDKGFFLAQGDRRGFVVLDHTGDVWSLPRMLDVKTKDVRARLGDGKDLPSVAQTQNEIGARMTPVIRRHIAESRAQFHVRSQQLSDYKTRMNALHREARMKLKERQERDWINETKARADRLPKGLRGLWWRITGRYQDVRRQNEHEAEQSRHAQQIERQSLIDQQLEQRRVLQVQVKDLRQKQAEQLLSLRSDVGRYLTLSRGHEASASHQTAHSQGHDTGLGLGLSR